MRLVVFGAAGGVGRRVVQVAADAGHEVVAASRVPPPADGAINPRVEPVTVDVRDSEAVRRAVVGVDAIVWCVGVTRRSGGDVGRTGLPYVVAAAGEHGVSRLVSVSGAGITVPGDRKGLGARLMSALTRRLAGELFADKQGEHQILAGSGLAWTEVRVPRLSDGSGSGRWQLVEDAPGPTTPPVPREDVAHAMVQLTGSMQWVHRSPFLVAGQGGR